MLMKRRTPLASSNRSLRPGCFFSRSSMTSARVPPVAVISSSPPVSVRRGAGMRTMVSILLVLLFPSNVGGRGCVALRVDTRDAQRGAAKRAACASCDFPAAKCVRLAVERHQGAEYVAAVEHAEGKIRGQGTHH